MTSAFILAAEALRKASQTISAMGGADTHGSAYHAPVQKDIDEALAALTAEQSRVPLDREALARELEAMEDIPRRKLLTGDKISRTVCVKVDPASVVVRNKPDWNQDDLCIAIDERITALETENAALKTEAARLRKALERIRNEDGIINHNGEWVNGPWGEYARAALSTDQERTTK